MLVEVQGCKGEGMEVPGRCPSRGRRIDGPFDEFAPARAVAAAATVTCCPLVRGGGGRVGLAGPLSHTLLYCEVFTHLYLTQSVIAFAFALAL